MEDQFKRDPAPVHEHSEPGRRWKNMVWTLVALVVLIVAVCALWFRLANDGGSTLAPSKSLPAASQSP